MSIKNSMYAKLVDSNPDVKAHYESYIISNPDYHKKHRMKSYQFLSALKKYYKNGQKGEFPKAPHEYTLIGRAPAPVVNTPAPAPVAAPVETVTVAEQPVSSDYMLVKNSAYFDAEWYLKEYPDVAESGMDPVDHYLTIGWKEFRRPGQSFSTLLYLNRYPDASEMVINPLVHFEKIGKAQKRVSSFKGLYDQVKKDVDIISNSKFFDKDWYREHNMKNDVTREEPALHYYCIGCYLGMEPGPLFDSKLFAKSYPEVKGLQVPPLLHYEVSCKNRGKGYINKSTSFYSNVNLQNKILREMLTLENELFSQGRAYEGKRVLLVSHIMNLTGAPRVCLNMAVMLKSMGYYPVMMTFANGDLNKEAKRNGISVVEMTCYEKKELSYDIVRVLNHFDFIVFNTVESLMLAHIFQGTKAKKIGWFHEGNETLDLMPEKQIKRINLLDEVCFGSPYCKKFFDEFLDEGVEPRTLLYGVDGDYITSVANGAANLREGNKVVFEIVGTIGYRKGIHVLLDAIDKLDDSVRENCEFWFIGSVIDPPVGEQLSQMMEKYSCIKRWDSVEYEVLIELEKNCDVLLCPSIDDPLPVVLTEAMILNKAICLSSNVGTAQFMEDKENALIFESGNVEELSGLLTDIVNGKYDLESIGAAGRRVFDEKLSLDIFRQNLEDLFVTEEKEDFECYAIDNTVNIHDIRIEFNRVLFVFSCDKDNELYLFSEGKTYHEMPYTEEHWVCLNDFLNDNNKRLSIIPVETDCLTKFKAIIGSNKYDTMDLHIADYSWLRFSQLANQNNLCLMVNEDIISFTTLSDFNKRVLASKKVPEGDKQLIKALSTGKLRYNVYTETRENKNDNAYTLFLYDLKTNEDAYFVTTKDVYDKEENPYIKEHLLILNSDLAKHHMIYAKNIIVSWHATPIAGAGRMKYMYPFIKQNYIFVPHGISYDKNSYYLHRSYWGYFTKVVCTSEFEKEYLEQCNDYKDVQVLGYPRLDKWADAVVDSKQIFLFPTWRDEIKDCYTDNIFEICKAITEKLPDHKLIYAAHPSVEKGDFLYISSRIKKLSKNIVTFMCSNGDMFNEYFQSAKYLITDYSSVAYDFAYKKDAVAIYYKPFWGEDNHYQFRDAFYENNCGIFAEDTQSIIDIVSDESSSEHVAEKAGKFFVRIDKGNSERVMEYIQK